MSKAIVILSVMLGMLILGSIRTGANPIAPPGDIILTSDPSGWVPFVYATEDEMTVDVYVFIQWGWTTSVTALGCSFSAPQPSCFNAAYVGETHYQPTTGDSQTGMRVYLSECLGPPILVARISYVTLGPTSECCLYWMLPHPDSESGLVEIVDCDQITYYAEPGVLVINPDGDLCGVFVPVEPSTWGKVKSLYAQ